MGSFIQNFHVFARNEDEVTRALAPLATADAYLVSSDHSWVSVYPEEQQHYANLARRISESLHTAVFCTGAYDSDVASYMLFEEGAVLDEFCSNPLYFADQDASAVDHGLRGRGAGHPEVLARFAKEQIALREIEAALGARDLIADRTLCRIAELFGIDPHCALASARYLSGDNPSIGERTAKIVKALPPSPAQVSPETTGGVHGTSLDTDPPLAEIWTRQESVEYFAKRLDWTEAEIDPIVDQLTYFAQAVCVVAAVASEAGWPAKKVLSSLTRAKWRMDSPIERAAEMAIVAVARRLTERSNKNLASHHLAYLSHLAYYRSPFPATLVPNEGHFRNALAPFYLYGILVALDHNILFDPFLQRAMRIRAIPGRAPSDGLTNALRFAETAAQQDLRGVLPSVEMVLRHAAEAKKEFAVWLTQPGDAAARSLERAAALSHRVSRHYESEPDLARAIEYCRRGIAFLELRYGEESEKAMAASTRLAGLTNNEGNREG